MALSILSLAKHSFGSDTGLMHASEALNTPVSMILGPTSSETGATINHPQSMIFEKNNLLSELNLKKFVQKGEVIIKLKDKDIIAPFSGALGFRGITEDVLGSENSFILTLDDSSEIFADLKIPGNFASVLKQDLEVKARFSGIKDKIFYGKVDGVSSRINAETRSILTRVRINNPDYELIPGSLLEVTLSFNKRETLSIPDTSIILEGNKAYVYKISKENIANRLEIQIGLRNEGNVEVISGLNSGDLIVAEGLKKVRPNGKIKPINKYLRPILGRGPSGPVGKWARAHGCSGCSYRGG